MPAAFSRTLKALDADSFGPRLLIAGLVLPLLAGWVAWARGSNVTVYAVSPNARTEIATAAVPVEALVAGRVLVSTLALGRHVENGEVLVELDASLEKAKLAEEKTKVEGLKKRLTPMQGELAALADIRHAIQRVAAARVGVASEQMASSKHLADRTRELSSISGRLNREGVGSKVEALQAELATAEKEDAFRQHIAEVRELTESKDLETRQAALRELELARQIADTEADIALGEAAMNTLELSIDHHTVRALVTGYLGDVVPLITGATATPGRPLATIIPEGSLRVVSYFTPQEAVGRVQPGQAAQIQFQGFPWTQFGISRASVVSVGAEPRENAVRVELVLDATTTTRVPLQHGMPASVEIAVDRASPWTMLLRSVGEWSTPAPSAPASAAPGREVVGSP